MTTRIRPHLIVAAILGLVIAACIGTTTTEPSASPSPPAKAAAATPAPTPPMPVMAALVRAVGAKDKQVLPEKRVTITLHGGYAYHDNDKIVTSGLSNAPVGTDVFLEGISKDPKDVKITSWKWTLEPPAFSKTKLDSDTAQRPRFVADRAGAYVVRVTATNEKGEKISSQLTVNAGVYAGVETCATCHNGSVQPDMVGKWQQTGHARQLDIAWSMYKDYTPRGSDYCIQCHTTGYNESDQARGWDDRARAAGWDPTKGSAQEWLVGLKTSFDQLMSSPLGALANIQCESCHGPGGSTHTAVKSYETGVCAQCHSAQPAQWEQSGHAKTGRANLRTAENPNCVSCHTGEGFVQVTVRGKEPVFPNMVTEDKKATLGLPTAMAPVSCVTCHDPHAATNPGEPRAGHSLQLRLAGEVKMNNGAKVDAEFAAACVTCHSNRRTPQYMQDFVDGEQQRGTHENTQADVLYGVGAISYGQALRNSPHIKSKEACLDCHMAASPVMDPGPDKKVGTRDDVKATSVGGHSWAMSGTFTGLANGAQVKDLKVQNVTGCNAKGCHAGDPLTSFDVKTEGDYDGNGRVESVQAEVSGLLKALAEKLPKDDKGVVLTSGISDKNSTKEQRQALWNYQLVNADGSKGIHNPDFVIQLLQTTYRQLTSSDVPNAKILR
jgi:predicted CXXCH cytochrome family protein